MTTIPSANMGPVEYIEIEAMSYLGKQGKISLYKVYPLYGSIEDLLLLVLFLLVLRTLAILF